MARKTREKKKKKKKSEDFSFRYTEFQVSDPKRDNNNSYCQITNNMFFCTLPFNTYNLDMCFTKKRTNNVIMKLIL